MKIIEVNAAWSFIKFMHIKSPLSFSLYVMTSTIWGVTLGHFGKFTLFFFFFSQSGNSTKREKCCFLVYVWMVNKVEALEYQCFWKDQSFLSHINVSLPPSLKQYSLLVQTSELLEYCRCIFLKKCMFNKLNQIVGKISDSFQVNVSPLKEERVVLL